MQELLDRFHVQVADVPVVICRGELVLRNPTNETAAECLGFNEGIDQTHLCDLVIVGAGPAGWRRRCMARQRDWMCWCWNRTRWAGFVACPAAGIEKEFLGNGSALTACNLNHSARLETAGSRRRVIARQMLARRTGTLSAATNRRG